MSLQYLDLCLLGQLRKIMNCYPVKTYITIVNQPQPVNPGVPQSVGSR